MAVEVKSIIVSLRARVGKLKKKMREASKSIRQRLGGAVKFAARQLKRLGIAAAAAAAGVVALVSRMAGGMDKTAKLADRLGTTTEELTAMQHAAEINGVEMETLNGSLERYNRRLGDAIGGTGQAAAALDKLGLDAASLSQLPLSEQMQRIADGMANVDTQAEKASIAAGLMGRSGMQMVNMLEQGGPAMRRLMQEAVELGRTYTDAQADQAEAYNDAMTRLKASFAGLARAIGIKLLPMLTNLAKQLTALIPRADDVKASFVGAAEAVITAWTWVESLFTGLGDTTTALALNVMYLLEKLTQDAKHLLLSTWELLKWFGGALADLYTGLGESLKAALGNMLQNMKTFVLAIKDTLLGRDADWSFKGMEDAWKVSIRKLPEIAAREMTDVERGLIKAIADAPLAGDNYEKALAARLKAFRESMRGGGDDTGDDEGGGGGLFGALLTGGRRKLREAVGFAREQVGGLLGWLKDRLKVTPAAIGEQGGVLGRGMSLAGLAMRAGGGPAEKTAENTERTANAADRSADALASIDRKLDSSAGAVVFTA